VNEYNFFLFITIVGLLLGFGIGFYVAGLWKDTPWKD
jgi:uncharacterized membrane protein